MTIDTLLHWHKVTDTLPEEGTPILFIVHHLNGGQSLKEGKRYGRFWYDRAFDSEGAPYEYLAEDVPYWTELPTFKELI